LPNSIRTSFAVLLLLAVHRPASADFMAAEAAERRGEHTEASKPARVRPTPAMPNAKISWATSSKRASVFQRT
jgi:hypothetical protein